MRYDAPGALALLALMGMAAPLPAATGRTLWIHVCGSEAAIPLRLPPGKSEDQQRACHAACLASGKRRAHRLCA